ncbi:NAD-binding protein [Fomitiporia mediterranea MF3/22]|uniref:NAD-binding protein n=1 Tax=Fomitiporia mediterranea (strain MF3/22) TaxID=694068 RepID=UPI0004407620|nr:NAD-binding protein [Fomitiporia mediterranea MF3/22]EJD04231.1 NAD-binding protein [Fomitiporia mediterranea MF3/22]
MPLSFSYLSNLVRNNPLLASVSLLSILFLLRRQHRPNKRQTKIPLNEEHVLILGASSGVGRTLAVQYVQRGAYVCIVARNKEGLEGTRRECLGVSESMSNLKGEGEAEKRVVAVVADFSDAEGMAKVRERIQAEWGRLDTLAVIAGVSSLRPLLETTGIECKEGRGSSFPDADVEGVRTGQQIASAAIQGNFTGPLTAVLTCIAFLERTSPSPSVLLLSSVAAVTPAPTRTLYCASKSAALILYQSLAIEHPKVHFTSILPGTIEGAFRASAVDGGLVRESDPNRSGLKREVVARRCIQAVDRQERDVFMQGFYRFAPVLYYSLCPGLIEWVASKKYKYT